MDIRQQCLYGSKRYSYIDAYITPLCRDYKERIVYRSADQLAGEGSAIDHDIFLVGFVYEPHWEHFLHSSDDDSSDRAGYSKNVYMDPE